MGKKVEMIGKRFGRWKVLKEGNRGKNGSIRYICVCNCGTIREVSGVLLRNGQSTSCGCYNNEIISKLDSVYNTKLYGVWNAMKQRCYNSNDKAYKNYGNRGIKICDDWKKDFRTFRKWAYENGYKEGLTIDRIDVNGNYEPCNCRWITRGEQQRNKRTNRLVTINGITKPAFAWAEEYSIPHSTFLNRLKLKWEDNDLLKSVDISKIRNYKKK